MTGRRRRDGERTPDDPGAGDPSRPRVQGAWDTPAVVVRAPDGSIVDPNAPPTTPTRPPASRRGDPAGDPADGASGAAAGAGSPPRPRVRPRRIPGAPGSVLVTPTLRPEAADGREERRRRRAEAPSASVTPLPPRPPAPDADAHDAAPARLRPVGHGRAPVSGRGARRPTPAHPGEPRRQRVLAAMSGLTLDRLLPADEEARDRRIARLRRVGTRVGSVTLAAMLIWAVFPIRTFLNQRAATDRAREQIDVLSRENDRLAERADDLRDEETIEEMARRELGLVKPGEESYGIFPAPEEEAPTTTTTAPDG